MPDFAAYHGTHRIATGDTLPPVILAAKEFLLPLPAQKPHATQPQFVVTVWDESACVLVAVVADDANGLTVHKLDKYS